MCVCVCMLVRVCVCVCVRVRVRVRVCVGLYVHMRMCTCACEHVSALRPACSTLPCWYGTGLELPGGLRAALGERPAVASLHLGPLGRFAQQLVRGVRLGLRRRNHTNVKGLFSWWRSAVDARVFTCDFGRFGPELDLDSHGNRASFTIALPTPPPVLTRALALARAAVACTARWRRDMRDMRGTRRREAGQQRNACQRESKGGMEGGKKMQTTGGRASK